MDQSEVDRLLSQFKQKYSGHYVDYYGYAGECISLCKRWLDVVRERKLTASQKAPATATGRGSDYWKYPPAMVNDYFRKETWSATKTYPAGSMVVYTHTSHIGIYLGKGSAGNVSLFEQNADPDGSPASTHQRPASRIDGVLVIKTVSVPKAEVKTVNPKTWNVRSGPGTDYKVIGVVKEGQKYATVKQSNGWRKITFNGKAGFVAGSAWR